MHGGVGGGGREANPYPDSPVRARVLYHRGHGPDRRHEGALSSSRTGRPRFAGDRPVSWSAPNGGLLLDGLPLSAPASVTSSRHGLRRGVLSGQADLSRLPSGRPPPTRTSAYFPVSPNASNAEPTKRRTPPAPQIMYPPIMPSRAPSKTSAMVALETKRSSGPSIHGSVFLAKPCRSAAAHLVQSHSNGVVAVASRQTSPRKRLPGRRLRQLPRHRALSFETSGVAQARIYSPPDDAYNACRS